MSKLINNKNTDGLLLKALQNCKETTIINVITFAMILWILSPLMIIPLSQLGVDSYKFNGIWIMILYFVGCVCAIFGGISIYKYILVANLKREELFSLFFPFVLLVILFLWILVSTLFCQEKRIAIYGYDSLRDNVITFLFYGGIVFGGFALANNKKRLLLIVKVFLAVSFIISIFSVFISTQVIDFVDSQYASVFSESMYNNVEYYGRLFLISSTVIMILFDRKLKKSVISILLILYLCFVSSIIIVGDRYSFYTSLIIALIYFVIGMIKKDKKLLVFLLILLLSLILCNWIDNIFNIPFSFVPVIEERKITLWKSAFRHMADVPIVGYGPQNLMFDSQNMFLQIAINIGGFGLIIFMFFLGSLSKNILSCNNRTIFLLVISYLLAGLFYSTLYYLAPYFYFTLGICLYNIIDDQKCKTFSNIS